MIKRTCSTFLLLALLFAVIYGGHLLGSINYGVVALATVFSTLALYEFYRLMQHMGAKPRMLLGLGVGALFIPTLYVRASCDGLTTQAEIILLSLAGVVLLYSLTLLRSQKIPNFFKQLSTAFGVLYLPFMIGFFVLIVARFGGNGVLLCVWALLATKFTDVGGLLGGLLACKIEGKENTHKLAPNISPNKTWEGVLGGLLCSMIVGAGTVAIFNACGTWQFAAAGTDPDLVQKMADGHFVWWMGALCALPMSLTSIVSDLVESVVKRNAGDKDSGATIPGMGGALDLLDSLVLAAPVAYLVIRFVIV
ncbi:MAG: phosphatidate cytidylyltransferase [Opitutales bacterium]|nr:phosphatidate cytidylyltransferase [Opitutales bacterium]